MVGGFNESGAQETGRKKKRGSFSSGDFFLAKRMLAAGDAAVTVMRQGS